MSRRGRVSVSKVRDYLLDPDHEEGGPKSVFFEAHGFDRSRHQQLADALVLHFEENEVSQQFETSFGTKLIVLGRLRTPDGRRPVVKSVWIVSQDDAVAEFVTAVPR